MIEILHHQTRAVLAVVPRKSLEAEGLRYRELTGADLTGAELAGAVLTGTVLDDAMLMLANQEGGSLLNASLRRIDGRGARLGRAKFIGADLRDAALKGADLAWANLCGADLRGSDLRHANLQQAFLWYADLRDARLAHCRLQGARYNESTRWPRGFRPEQHGARLASFIGCDEEFRKQLGKTEELAARYLTLMTAARVARHRQRRAQSS